MSLQSIIDQRTGSFMDSREVAELLGKPHSRLVKEIKKNIGCLTDGNIPADGFFIESSYVDSAGRRMFSYLLTKIGCAMMASRTIGKKGLLLTAACAKRFDEIEFAERAEPAAIAAITLDEHKRKAGLGEDSFDDEYSCDDFEDDIEYGYGLPDHRYSVTEIAVKFGIFSMHGNPHVQAVACLLNEIIVIDSKHKSMQKTANGDREGKRAVYDSHAVIKVLQWLIDNECPDEIYGFGRTFYIDYKD